jgi:hypothetical protein
VNSVKINSLQRGGIDLLAYGEPSAIPGSCRNGPSGARGMSSKRINCARPKGKASSILWAALASVMFSRNTTPFWSANENHWSILPSR